MTTHAGTLVHGARGSSVDETFFAEHGRERVPRLVQWFATGRCPLACPHCIAADDAGEGGADMPLSSAIRLIEQVADLGVPEFLLTGGEPLARPDLSDVIASLRANGVRWSLNTAVMPARRTRAAIEAWPPGFVAVSLDGPARVHDAFRGRAGAFDDARTALRYFAGLGARTAAGTTVTARNLAHLGETFGIVLGSGADAWGLHLLVPEGRAAGRPDLALSRREVRRLIDFAAAKRTWFPVTMADEIGYCGRLEPLLRDTPFYCGAGRSGCVVLPDGEVVPCTTTDRSTSAGNVADRPLREIWETGFAELRRWTLRGRCADCGYAAACGGGCWLQRRHGTHCYRETWHTSGALKTAAGVAVCLGLAAAGSPAPAQAPAPSAGPAAHRDGIEFGAMEVLQRSIIRWYAAQTGGHRAPPAPERVLDELAAALPEDPGARYFLAFARGARAADFAGREAAIREAFDTGQRSLCLVGLAWRDLLEGCLDGPPAIERTPAERLALRRATALVAETAEAWRREILEDRLDPFLRRPLQAHRFFMSKAGPSPVQAAEGRIAQARWGRGEAVTEAVLEERPFAAALEIEVRIAAGGRLERIRHGTDEVEELEGGFRLRAFDLLRVPAEAPVQVESFAANRRFAAELPAGTELAYGDVLRLVHEQNREAWPEWLGRPGFALAIPELRVRLRRLAAERGPDAPMSDQERTVRWVLANHYLF